MPDSLAQEVIDHKKSDPDKCVSCGSLDVGLDNMSTWPTLIVDKMRCAKCGKEWIQSFSKEEPAMDQKEIDRIDEKMIKNDEESLVYSLYRDILEVADTFEQYTGLNMDHVDDDMAEEIAKKMLKPYKKMKSFEGAEEEGSDDHIK